MEETTQEQTPQAEQQQDAGAAQGQEPDYKALAEEWKAKARKWETSSRKNADKAKAYDEAQAKNATVEERLAALENENKGLKEAQARAALVKAVAGATGVSADIVASLNGTDENELTAQAQAIAAAFKAPSAPSAPEAGKLDHGTGKPTKKDILAIKDPKERIRQIALNPELFERK